MDTALLAVNGTLMRGLELNPNLVCVGATFVREDKTEACYRVWSIDDRHPAMLRTPGEGAAVAVEVWDVPLQGLAKVLQTEPPGLCIGKVKLADGRFALTGAALPKGTTHVEFPSNVLHYKEVQVHGSYASRHRDQVAALDMLAADAGGIRSVVSDIIGLDETPDAFPRIRAGEALKVVVAP